MSGSLNELNLRWVRYDGIYYAAMLVPPADSPVAIGEGQQFVYFLDGEAGSVVADADVAPFDPDDVEKASTPEAMAGVAIAKGLLDGSSSSTGRTPGAVVATSPNQSEYADITELEAELEDENGDLLGLLPRKEKSDKKEKKEKKEKKKEKKRKHRHQGSDAEDQEDDGSDAEDKIKKEKKKKEKKAEKAKRRRVRDSDDEENDDELFLTSGKQEKDKKDKRRSRHTDSEDDEASDSDSSDSTEEEEEKEVAGAAARVTKAKAVKEADHWSGFAEDYGFGDGDDDDATVADAVMGLGDASRRGGRRAGGNLMSSALSALSSRASPVTLYLPQIKHAYLRIRQEAAQENKIVSAYEGAVVQATERRIRVVQMEILRLNSALQDPNLTREDQRKLKKALDALQKDDIVNVEEIARAVVQICDAPPDPNGRSAQRRDDSTVGTEEPRRHKLSRNVSVFQDPSTIMILKEAASQAEQRDMAGEVAQRYREQLLRRQQVMEARRTSVAAALASATMNGRPSSGYCGTAPTPLEKFFQSREAASLVNATVMATANFEANNSTLSSSQGANTQRASGFNDYGLRFMTNTSGTSTTFLGASSQPLSALNHHHHLGSDGSNGLTGGSTTIRPHNVRTTVADDTLNLFNSSNTALRQSRSAAMIPAFYNFDSIVSSTQDGNDVFRGLSSLPQQGGTDGGLATGDMLQVSPVHLPFDHRAVFAIQPDEDARMDGSTMRSSMVSASYNVDAQPSLWYDGVSGAETDFNSAVTPHHDSKAHSSRASSASHGRRGKSAPNDWRAGAKRCILEMLTLYYKGMRGRPPVLDLETFHSVAKLLLDRAMRQEAERQNMSMALRSANLTAPFTKEVEAAIKKSVESYVERHFVNRVGGSRREEREEESAVEENASRPSTGRVLEGEPVTVNAAAADDDIEYQA